MDVYKNFLQRLRRKEMDDVYLLLAEGVSPKLKEYVLLLKNVKLEGGSYHTIYGEVKRIVASFIKYYTTTIDEVIKVADTYTNVVKRNDLVLLMERTTSIHQANQIEFRNDFLPIKTLLETQISNDIDQEYKAYKEKLLILMGSIQRLDTPIKVYKFAKEHFPKSVKKTDEIFEMVLVYLGMMLADNMKLIRFSIEEIHRRVVKNLNEVQKEHEEIIDGLLHQLYDKNKECMMITRSEANYDDNNEDPRELAEVIRSIDTLKLKIENFRTENSLSRLEEEVAYWTSRIKYFNEISGNLTKLKADQDCLIQSEEAYSSIKCNEISRCKSKCWETKVANAPQRMEELTRMIINEAKALMTFFALRGADRISYSDNNGRFYLDEFDHKVYIFDHSLKKYHVDCEGEFQDFPDYEYYYDRHGRYIKNDDGEKVYQCAPCTSHYKMDEAGLLTKVTKDCGHSEIDNKNCKMEVSASPRMAILPDLDTIDIKNTLDTDTVKYLWDSFGSVLPMALNDVGKARPLNPIHFLAHKLLHHKYSRTKDEKRQKKKEAEQYRADIYQKRFEKAVAESKKCKSKQVKPRKPEESDDAEGRAVYNAQVAELMFINSLNVFDD